MSNIIIDNIDRVHTTEMGIDRIKRNLSLSEIDVVAWCRSKILDKDAVIPASNEPSQQG